VVSPEALGVGLYQEEGIGSKKGRKHYREVWPLMRLFFSSGRFLCRL
jgi:hypothetical protein